MCGRFVRASPEDVIRRAFGVTSAAPVDFRPRYNIAPGESVATIVADGETARPGEHSDGPRDERLGTR
ncbi:MAG: SOS response-associated peptidase family protein, partial [Candidatus Binatia bacterium]